MKIDEQNITTTIVPPSILETVKVDDAQLIQTADRLQSLQQKLRNDLNALNKAMDNTKSYWKGSAADAYRKSYDPLKKRIEEVNKELEDIPKRLREMSSTYKGASNEAKVRTEALNKPFLQ